MRAILACIIAVPLLVVLTGCPAPTDPNTSEYWIYKLDNKRERNEALKQLGKIGDKKALPHVIEWFEKEGEWQPDAAYALGQLGDKSVVPKLVAAIDYQVGTGRDRITRNKNRTNINAVRALAMLKATEATDNMIKLLDTHEPTVREATIKSLGKLGDPKAVDALIKVAKNDKEPFLRKTAIQALGDIADAKAIPTLIEMLFIEVPGISFYNEARYSLIQMGDAAIPELMKTLKRENKTVEAITLSDGRNIGEGAIEAKAGSVLGYLKAAQAEQLMLDALNRLYGIYSKAMKNDMAIFGSVPGAIRELCYAVGNLGTKNAVKALTPIASDPDENVRETATDALTQIGDRTVVKALLIAARDGSAKSRRFAMQAASRLGTGDDLGAFDALAKAPMKEKKKGKAKKKGKEGGEDEDANIMKKMVERERVRLLAAQECKEDITCWRGKLKDQDPRVRDKAAWELGYLGGKDARGDLLAALEDDSAVVRMAAVLSLGRIGGADPAKLEEIHDKYAKKLDYAGVNLELKRLIAHLKAEARKGKK
jgi:HEAT repeat protein